MTTEKPAHYPKFRVGPEDPKAQARHIQARLDAGRAERLLMLDFLGITEEEADAKIVHTVYLQWPFEAQGEVKWLEDGHNRVIDNIVKTAEDRAAVDARRIAIRKRQAGEDENPATKR